MFKGDIAKNTTHLSFNDPKNLTVHTFNFMNVARASPPKLSYITDTLFDSNIEASANYVNNELTLLIPDLSTSFHNEWIIMDYPSADSIRSVYESNFSKDLKLLNYKLNLNNGDTSFGEGIKYLFSRLVTLFDKRNMNTDEPQACLQRIINKQGSDLIKTDYRCINNALNQWRIRISGKGKFYSLISVYDEKCLNYSNNSWYMQECMSNNKREDFTIRNGKICSRLDESQCLEGQFNLEPTIFQPSEYENLTCSTKFVKRGYKCCSNPNTKVEYVDSIGNWGIENGKLCGLGYTRCSFETIGYPCCSSVNPGVVDIDNDGNKWGFEDGNWCGIGEVVHDSRIRIKNRKTQECLITNLHSDDTVLLLGDCNHSI